MFLGFHLHVRGDGVFLFLPNLGTDAIVLCIFNGAVKPALFLQADRIHPLVSIIMTNEAVAQI